MTTRITPDPALQVVSSRTVKGNIEFKTAAMLCYTPILLISVIAPILFLSTEPKNNNYLRFHAIQALLITATAVAVGVANSIIFGIVFSVLGWGVASLFLSLGNLAGLAVLAGCLYAMYCVHQGKEFRIPVISDIAEKNA